MGRTCSSSLLIRALKINHGPLSVPLFLVPSAHHIRWSRPFSASYQRPAKLPKMPVAVPSDVTLTMLYPRPPKDDGPAALSPQDPSLRIEGPLGKMTMAIPHYMTIQRVKPDGPIAFSVADAKDRQQREMWGTMRAYVANHIAGVSEGHLCVLRLVGVGYRASVEDSATTKVPEYDGQQFVNLKVGYSHPVELGVPRGVKASTPQPTRILLEGIDKMAIKQFAANIRKWRVPEPYKGKGIFVDDETIRLKSKKIK